MARTVTSALLLLLASTSTAAGQDAACPAAGCRGEEGPDGAALLQVARAPAAGAAEGHAQGGGAQLPGWLLPGLSEQEQKENEFWIPPGSLDANRPPLPVERHEPLAEPPELRPDADGTVDLYMDAVKVGVPWVKKGEYIYTRGYNGGFPGPTIRVKQGMDVTIKLENRLGWHNPTCKKHLLSNIGKPWDPSQICMLNTTNLHTHGLHISSMASADNMFLPVVPGMTQNFDLHIVADHMGGTHWYHPHHHHSTAAQAGGGAFGALIVEDPPNSLPPQVQHMPEKVMMIALVDFDTMTRLESWGEGDLWKPALGSDLSKAAPEVLVNGQREASLELAPGQWYRWRMIFAAVEMSLVLTQDETSEKWGTGAQCEWQLLAKDGIFLPQAPRRIHKIYLGSGNRADVAVRCTCRAGRECGSRIHWQAYHSVIGMGRVAPNLAAFYSGSMLHLRVSPSAEGGLKPQQRITDAALPSFAVTRPCYLADLRWARVKPENKHILELPVGGLGQYAAGLAADQGLLKTFSLMIKWDGEGKTFTSVDPVSPPLAEIKLGEVYEARTPGVKYHPLHIHVLPYQIVHGGAGMNADLTGQYFADGDWHDTILSAGLNEVTIRFQTDRFPGKYLIHCHILEHEDNGMMAYINVNGKDGEVWPYAEWVEPGCYREGAPKPGYKLL